MAIIDPHQLDEQYERKYQRWLKDALRQASQAIKNGTDDLVRGEGIFFNYRTWWWQHERRQMWCHHYHDLISHLQSSGYVAEDGGIHSGLYIRLKGKN